MSYCARKRSLSKAFSTSPKLLIVIKSLGEVLKGHMGFAGGAILGDGKVGLILDVAGLLELSPTQVNPAFAAVRAE